MENCACGKTTRNCVLCNRMELIRNKSPFTSFDVFKHTSDEVEFRVNCKDCGISAMDVENSCITCDCDWFQNKFNNKDTQT